ncbi:MULTISPECIES: hypothetical protein [Rhizobium]|uniref:hypothetical protein n=1 Tax=Rhizobium TaxID=379 RepID=UPI00195DC6BB|nr:MULTISPECIES: hypothetical protein [Rhizobium]MBM7044544.1 hypothetical protein [Rhizobium lusitanum]
MRRNLLLGGVAGAVVGSWLTLIVVQLGEHGFALPHRSDSGATSENRPAETAKAHLTPPRNTEAPKPVETASSKTQPEDQAKAQPAKPAPDKVTPSAATPASTTTSDSDTKLSAAAARSTPVSDDDEKAPGSDVTKVGENKAATAQPATPQENKPLPVSMQSNGTSAKPDEAQPAQSALPTPGALKNTDTASDQTSGSTEVAADKPNAAPVSPQADPTPDNRMPADQIDRQMAASEHQTLPPQLQSGQASLGDAQKPPEQATPIELVRPFADQAGVLTIAGKSVQLTGIIPTDVNRMCTGPSGKSWPCGSAARTAFRMYLRGRTIDCDLPSATWQGTVKGACRYVRVDLSAWLVRFGWAEPEPGSPLMPLVEEAKQKQRGMYGDDPRKTGKSTLGPALPKEDPLNPI